MPTLTLEEQLGQKLLTLKVNIKALIKSWEGTLTKGEFRPRLKSLFESLGLAYPGYKVADELFEKFDDDSGGTIDNQELVAAFEMLVEAGRRSRDVNGAHQMDLAARAGELQGRAELCEKAAASIERADYLESELNELKVAIASNLATQVGLTVTNRRHERDASL